MNIHLHTNNVNVSIGLDPDINPDEEEEKRRLITQVLELQNTLDGKVVTSFQPSLHEANCRSLMPKFSFYDR